MTTVPVTLGSPARSNTLWQQTTKTIKQGVTKIDTMFRRFRNAGVFVAIGIAFVLFGCSDSSSFSTRFTNEGSLSSPVTLTIGQTHNGTVAALGVSLYRFTTTVAGSYTIALKNTASDLSWTLYDNVEALSDESDYLFFCDNYLFQADEICFTPFLPASTPFLVVVNEWDRIGGRFNLLVSAP